MFADSLSRPLPLFDEYTAFILILSLSFRFLCVIDSIIKRAARTSTITCSTDPSPHSSLLRKTKNESGGDNPSHLTLPDNQAALAPFPPGCPVLVSGSSGDSETSAAHASPQTYLGQVHSVYIDLGSTTRDNFYRVRPSSAAPAEAATELRSAAESALKYAPGCTVTVNASALPPFVTDGGGGDTRDATIISCVGGGVSGGSNYYLLDVMHGLSDSWDNIQSTVPVDSVRYRALTVESKELGQDGYQDNRAINNNPHPHMIPADEDGSLKSTSKDPPVASIAFDNTGSRKRPAQLDADDGGSSTLSPMPTDGSIRVASSNAIAEEVVRRIDILDTVDVSKVKGALVGSDNKINQRMQTKFGVIISILGLDDAVTSSVVGSFSKLGPISYKVGDKCIMIQGSERKVHDAAKVVIHMLVNKCYDGKEKDTLMRKLRVVPRYGRFARRLSRLLQEHRRDRIWLHQRRSSRQGRRQQRVAPPPWPQQQKSRSSVDGARQSKKTHNHKLAVPAVLENSHGACARSYLGRKGRRFSLAMRCHFSTTRN